MPDIRKDIGLLPFYGVFFPLILRIMPFRQIQERS